MGRANCRGWSPTRCHYAALVPISVWDWPTAMRQIETAVVGGGPAGAATACGLAALGHEVMVLERALGPHRKVCGEFLSIETQAQLNRLGVDPLVHGAVSIDHVSLYSATCSVTATLPFRAMSLSRYRLDQALLQSAADRGAEVRRNVSVRSATPDGMTWMLSFNDGETVRCRNLVLATGKWGLRGIDDTRDGSLVGLKMHFQPSAETGRVLAGRVEVSLLGESYVGLELVENGIANLCLLLPRDVVARLGPGWSALQRHLATTLPGVAARLDGATPLWDKPVAVVCPTGGYLHADSRATSYRVGDRLAHIPPFTGDGLAIALGSAALAVEHIRLGLSPASYLAAARRLVGKTVRLASIVSGLAASSIGRAALMEATVHMPSLIRLIVRRTRLPLPAESIR